MLVIIQGVQTSNLILFLFMYEFVIFSLSHIKIRLTLPLNCILHLSLFLLENDSVEILNINIETILQKLWQQNDSNLEYSNIITNAIFSQKTTGLQYL